MLVDIKILSPLFPLKFAVNALHIYVPSKEGGGELVVIFGVLTKFVFEIRVELFPV